MESFKPIYCMFYQFQIYRIILGRSKTKKNIQRFAIVTEIEKHINTHNLNFSGRPRHSKAAFLFCFDSTAILIQKRYKLSLRAKIIRIMLVPYFYTNSMTTRLCKAFPKKTNLTNLFETSICRASSIISKE